MTIGSSIDALMGQLNTRAWITMTNQDINLINQLITDADSTNLTCHKTLTDLGIKYNTDKVFYHNYTDFYDSLFHFNKNNIKLLLEVGVASGSSVKMWRDYFNNSIIHCFDYNNDTKTTVENIPNTYFHFADQESKVSLKSSLHMVSLNSADIIIDDGGHFSSQQRNTLEVFWSYLKSGGIYIIEDIHTNVKHWYPTTISWNKNKHYWDESPTMLETIHKIQFGKELDNNELSISTDEIKQVILWTQPNSTSATVVLFKK